MKSVMPARDAEHAKHACRKISVMAGVESAKGNDLVLHLKDRRAA